MVDVVASIQSAIEIVGKLRKLSKTIEDADFKMLLADLSGELADARLEVADLKTKLAEAVEEKQKQRQLIEQRSSQKPDLVDGVYKFKDEEGLFCTACFDTKGTKVRVTPLTGPFKTFGKWSCPSCKATFS
jgi:hypothetical protein